MLVVPARPVLARSSWKARCPWLGLMTCGHCLSLPPRRIRSQDGSAARHLGTDSWGPRVGLLYATTPGTIWLSVRKTETKHERPCRGGPSRRTALLDR
nr:hypothetical protein CFP56_07999 [Quercus suber]